MTASLDAIRLDVTARALAYARRLSQNIETGWPTTWEYRRFCAERGYGEADGVFLRGAPLPFPLRDPVQCTACGFIAELEDVETNPRFSKRVSAGFNVHGPGDGEPPEWTRVCPECRIEEASFDPVTKCAECDDYPCTCGEEDFN